MNKISRNKISTINRLSLNVLRLEESKGHLKWKVQELADRSNISRSLIYEYLGSNKKEILLNALRYFIDEFYGFSQAETVLTFSEQIQQARKKMALYPEAVIFYQKWRSRPSWLQNEFISIEERFHNKLKNRFPQLDQIEIRALHSLIHGLVTAPFLDDKESDLLFKFFWSRTFKVNSP